MRSFAIVAALLLAACNQPVTEVENNPQAAENAQANDCPAAATSEWRGASAIFTIAATAEGPDCATARVTLELKNDDVTAFQEVYEVNQVMVLAGAESPQDLERRLHEWITPAGAASDSTADLPPWPAGAAQPDAGEFPFYPEDGIDRAAYEALRARDAPMFCFVQGMESQACLVDENGALSKVGVQTFPG